MDIAEIRKKAKTAKPAKKKPAEPVAPIEPEVEEVEEIDFAAEGEPGALSVAGRPGDVAGVSRVDAAVPDSGLSGLDKLFADVGMLELASEEAYHEILASQGDQQARNVRQYLAFNLGREEYALDIAQISEIIKLRKFTDIPRVPEFVLGIISLRGVVVPIFDLMKRFRLGESVISAASRIIVCQEGELQVGLLVDSINQVIALAEKDVEPPPAVLTGFDRDLVKGVGRFQGRMIIILHLASVLDVGLS